MYRPAVTLTVNNAQTALEAGLRAIADGQTEIDLADLSVVDSGAVATMLAWQRAAQRTGKKLLFRNPSANLQSLITLYGVDELLVIAAAAAPRSDLLHH
ncbi:STAS domain-containing protein [Noviherbaspirillum saxi]|uniref:STAS domain-containing protein n=1 Tax=Noviherbaspirillum saxi TaxID=2320863 RepID=A0A3A3FU02_9BURK|nr:STAS domain-containing protein [Noviherbaspirillum saxi]RJF99672.1 STAS domain-containing protein [Noviherbaspirillum saxi]